MQYLNSWSCFVLFHFASSGLCWGLRDLVPWPGTKSGLLHWENWVLAWITREVPEVGFQRSRLNSSQKGEERAFQTGEKGLARVKAWRQESILQVQESTDGLGLTGTGACEGKEQDKDLNMHVEGTVRILSDEWQGPDLLLHERTRTKSQIVPLWLLFRAASWGRDKTEF